jgi:hypothetical protein
MGQSVFDRIERTTFKRIDNLCDWNSEKSPTFSGDVFAHTDLDLRLWSYKRTMWSNRLFWLRDEHYVTFTATQESDFGIVTLTAKGLEAMQLWHKTKSCPSNQDPKIGQLRELKKLQRKSATLHKRMTTLQRVVLGPSES